MENKIKNQIEINKEEVNTSTSIFIKDTVEYEYHKLSESDTKILRIGHDNTITLFFDNDKSIDNMIKSLNKLKKLK